MPSVSAGGGSSTTTLTPYAPTIGPINDIIAGGGAAYDAINPYIMDKLPYLKGLNDTLQDYEPQLNEHLGELFQNMPQMQVNLNRQMYGHSPFGDIGRGGMGEGYEGLRDANTYLHRAQAALDPLPQAYKEAYERGNSLLDYGVDNLLPQAENYLEDASELLPQAQGTFERSYADAVRNMSPIANGDMLDPNKNTYLQGLLSTIQDRVQNSVGGQFAAAGRSFSGAHNDALGEGMAAGLAQPLFQNQQFESGRHDAANQFLSGLGTQQGQNYTGLSNSYQGLSGGYQGLANTYGNFANSYGNMAAQYGQGLLGYAGGLGNVSSGLQSLSGAFDQTAMQQANYANGAMGGYGQWGNLPYSQLNNYSTYPYAGLNAMTGMAFAPSQQYSNLILPIADAFKKSETESSMFSAGMGMSDRRTKEAIEPIGETYDGQTIYRFRYKGMDQTQIGLMADEVEQITPEAVREGADGFKRVDYHAATNNAVLEGAF
jgi:hypothetical protein